MKKLLIVAPHFSTGGSCQVTLNKIELLKNHFIIQVVEYSFLSWQFIVQRNKVIELVGKDHFHTLSNNKKEQFELIIQEFKPDVLAMEEFPEMFMDKDCSDWLYNYTDRPYIIETTHDSSFNPHNKKYFPNEFVFVSAYSALKYSHLNVKSSIIEYPVDFTLRASEEARKKLDFEGDYKHVVIVGLFTPRKNQAYAFDLAEKLKDYNIKFHFVGNQAENFASYWKPLMDRKPKNCIVWGEREDIHTFLNAADLFLFPSKGDRGNKELNPIVIKEAQNYVNLEKLLFNLDVYLNKYNDKKDFHFLTGETDVDMQKIIDITKSENRASRLNEEIIIVGTYPNTKKREELTKECIASLKRLDRKIMLVSHYPVDVDIQKMVDFYVFDEYNPLTHHSYYTHFYRDTSEYYAQVNINGLKDSNQSLAVLTNMYNAMKMSTKLGFKRAFYITFDVIVHREDFEAINQSFKCVNENKFAYLATLDTPFGKGIQTNGMTFYIDKFIQNFADVRTPEEFNAECKSLNCHNFLEDYFMKAISIWHENSYTLVHNPLGTFLTKSGLGASSNSEYYSILPIEDEPNAFMFYFFTYNQDERKMAVTFEEKGKITDSTLIDIKYQNEFKQKINYENNSIKITIQFNEGNKLLKIEEYTLSPETLDKFKNNGIYKNKVRPTYKIKLIHLQTTLNDQREEESRKTLSKVSEYGWEYVLHTNKPYVDLPPKFNCLRPDCVSMDLFDEDTIQRLGTALTPPHYGCYQAFKEAILSEFDESLDLLVVCEGDCKIDVSMEQFIHTIEDTIKSINKHNIGYMSYGDKKTLEHGWEQSPVVEEIPNQDLLYVTNHIIGLQCIAFSKSTRKWLQNTLRQHHWDAADCYFNSVFVNSPYKMSILYQRITTQFNGYSLIDQTNKTFI